LTGGAGNDLIIGGPETDAEFGGAGDDTSLWNPGDGNDIFEGQEGQDTLLFNGANIGEEIVISANGPRLRFTRDIANIVMDCDDVEKVLFTARGAADLITVNDLSGTDVREVKLDLSAVPGVEGGDGVADTVIVNGTALLPVSFVSDVAGRYTHRDMFTHVGWWSLFYGALATPLTALAGWMWAAETGNTDRLISTHKWLGLSLVVGFVAMAIWRRKLFILSRAPGIGYFLAAAIVIAALMYQGYLGGKMTLG